VLAACLLCRYDTEAAFFDSSVRREHRVDLEAKLLDVIEEPVSNQLRLLGAQELAQFDRDFRLALAENVQGFSRSADEAKAAAVKRFNSGCTDILIESTPLTGKQGSIVVHATRLQVVYLVGRLLLNLLLQRPPAVIKP
jgi:hypothetical protein